MDSIHTAALSRVTAAQGSISHRPPRSQAAGKLPDFSGASDFTRLGSAARVWVEESGAELRHSGHSISLIVLM